jgi:murein DD-endopeptidase MepM/ murein hydrolase activator NlpD
VSGRPASGIATLVAAVTLAACGVGRPDPRAALRARGLMVPVAGVAAASVPDTYDATRSESRRHEAVDIPALRGTAVVSADDGVVIALRQNRRGGLTVYATDPDRTFVYYYAHLDRYRDGLCAGSRVERGSVLGEVGTTGNADPSAPHLHFQVMQYPSDGRWWDGRPIDPRPFFESPGRAR